MKLAVLLFVFSPLYLFSQTDSTWVFKGIVIDNETNKPLPNTQTTLTGIDGSQISKNTDSLGYFEYNVLKKNIYSLEINPDCYLVKRYSFNAKEVRDSINYIKVKKTSCYIVEYFPDFNFEKNSSDFYDTTTLSNWDINNFHNTKIRYKVIGYCSPDEPKKIARKRAKSVINAFVAIGATRKTFVSVSKARKYPKILFERYYNVNGQEIMIDEKIVLSNKYLKSAPADIKDAIYQFMRMVQLEYK